MCYVRDIEVVAGDAPVFESRHPDNRNKRPYRQFRQDEQHSKHDLVVALFLSRMRVAPMTVYLQILRLTVIPVSLIFLSVTH